MTDLSPEAKELLRKARTAYSPSAERLEAVRHALGAQIAASHSATHLTSSPASGVATRALGAAGWGTGHYVSAVLLIGALGAGGLTAWLTADRPDSRSSVPIDLPAQAEPESAAAPPTPENEANEPTSTPPTLNTPPTSPAAPSDLAVPSKAPPAPRDPTRATAKTRPKEETPREPPSAAPATDSLEEEVRMLRDARAALDRGDAVHALRLLDAHETRFQHGTLYEERLATRVQVLCALGRTDGARSTAQELERAAPRSPHLPRVRASCIAQPPSK